MLLLGFNAFGLSLFYCVQIEFCKIKESAISNIADKGNTLTLFSSSTKNFKLVGDDEIEGGGMMFDIVKTKTQNGTTLYYAQSDNDEDWLLQKLSNTEKGNPAEKSLPGKSIRLGDPINCSTEKTKQVFTAILTHRESIKTVNDNFIYPAVSKDIYAPPPDNSAA